MYRQLQLYWSYCAWRVDRDRVTEDIDVVAGRLEGQKLRVEHLPEWQRSVLPLPCARYTAVSVQRDYSVA